MIITKALALTAAALVLGSSSVALNAQEMIKKNNIQLKSDLMTPEALWAMGRLGGVSASPNGKQIAYQVSYYSVKANKSHTMLFVQSAKPQKVAEKPFEIMQQFQN